MRRPLIACALNAQGGVRSFGSVDENPREVRGEAARYSREAARRSEGLRSVFTDERVVGIFIFSLLLFPRAAQDVRISVAPDILSLATLVHPCTARERRC